MNTKEKIQTRDQVLISGMNPEPVRQVTGPVAGLAACAGDRHCCSHGSGPTFPCCRCGSTFRAVRS